MGLSSTTYRPPCYSSPFDWFFPLLTSPGYMITQNIPNAHQSIALPFLSSPIPSIQHTHYYPTRQQHRPTYQKFSYCCCYSGYCCYWTWLWVLLMASCWWSCYNDLTLVIVYCSLMADFAGRFWRVDMVVWSREYSFIIGFTKKI